MARRDEKNRQIDGTDKEILRILQDNSKTPFLEIARRLGLSGATIHERVNALREAGIIKSFSVKLDEKRLRYPVTAIIGVTLEHPSLDTTSLKEALEDIKEITEAHNLTGDSDLLLKIKARDIEELRGLLQDRVQNLPGVMRLSTSVVLDSPLDRDLRI